MWNTVKSKNVSQNDYDNLFEGSTVHNKHDLNVLLPVAGVLHRLFGWDVHIRWEGFVDKSPKSHAEVARGAVHGLGQAFAQRPQAE